MGKTKISLKAARINANLTQKAAAKSVNVEKETISSWERGKSEPKVSQAYTLCELYGVPIDDVVFCPKNSPKARSSTKFA